jgi:hypothetical protein
LFQENILRVIVSGHQNPSSKINPKTHGFHQRGMHLNHRVYERLEGYVEFARKEFIGKVSVWNCESGRGGKWLRVWRRGGNDSRG